MVGGGLEPTSSEATATMSSFCLSPLGDLVLFFLHIYSLFYICVETPVCSEMVQAIERT